MADHRRQDRRRSRGAAPVTGPGTLYGQRDSSQAFDRRLPILEAEQPAGAVPSARHRTGSEPGGSGARAMGRRRGDAARRKGAGKFNQALMELGALVCTLAPAELRGMSAGGALQRPANGASGRNTAASEAAKDRGGRRPGFGHSQESRVLIVQRPSKGRWAGLWEFPHHELTANEGHAAAARRLLERIELQADVGAELLTVRHSVTRFRITLVCLEARHRRGKFRSDLFQQGCWVAPAQLQDYPFSSPRRLAQAVEASRAP